MCNVFSGSVCYNKASTNSARFTWQNSWILGPNLWRKVSSENGGVDVGVAARVHACFFMDHATNCVIWISWKTRSLDVYSQNMNIPLRADRLVEHWRFSSPGSEFCLVLRTNPYNAPTGMNDLCLLNRFVSWWCSDVLMYLPLVVCVILDRISKTRMHHKLWMCQWQYERKLVEWLSLG